MSNFPVFTVVCYHCHTVCFQYLLHEVYCLLHKFLHLWHKQPQPQYRHFFLVNITIHVLKLSWHQNSINFSSADSHIKSFNNVIYVFLLLWLCILIVRLCMATLTEVFPCFFLSCKANATVKPAKTEDSSHSYQFLSFSMYFSVVLCIFVLFYCLFCDVLSIVCVYMCTELLPPGG